MLDFIFQTTVNNVCFSLALALAAAFVGIALKRPLITHLLWMLVLLKLLTPPFLSISAIPIPLQADSPATAGLEMNTGKNTLAVEEVRSGDSIRNAPVHSETASLSTLPAKGWLLFAWLLGSGAVLSWSLLRVYRFHRLLRKESRAAGADIQKVAAEIASRLGLRTVPTIDAVSCNIFPMVWWVGGKVWVVVPDALLRQMDVRQLQSILAHELAHVRRRDYLVRWVEWLACVFFWWNPVAWWARWNLRANEELCCDALVLSSQNAEPHGYGNSLLTTVEILAGPDPRPSVLASGISGKVLLKKRVQSIVSNEQNRSNLRWLHTCILLAALTVLPLGLMYCKTNQNHVADLQESEIFNSTIYVEEGGCPFEGCTYGIWDVLKDAAVYIDPDRNTQKLGVLHQGEKIRALTGNVYVNPGRAKVTGPLHSSVKNIDPEKEIFILDYVGEGRSRVYQDGVYSFVKIARSKSECRENPDKRYCWVDILEEPVVQWWVQIESLDGALKGWVLMEGDVLEPIDSLAFGQDSFRAVIDDPDGYTNVRERPTIQSQVIYKINDGEEFLCYPDQHSNWWKVITNTKLSGYVHKSRIKDTEKGDYPYSTSWAVLVPDWIQPHQYIL